MPFRFSALVILAACSTASVSCSGKVMVPDSNAPETAGVKVVPLPIQEKPGEPIKLSEVVDSTRNGRDADSEELRAKYDRQARIYIKFRTGEIKGEQRRALIQACNSTGSQAQKAESKSGLDPEGPFCAYIQGYAFGTKKARSLRYAHRARQDAEIRAALAKGNLKALADRREGDFVRALKKVPNLAKIQATVDAALTATDCPQSALLTALGFKHEEFFPEEATVAKAMSLYQRSLQCGDGNDVSAMKAGYRLSLLHLWKSQYKEAEAVLDKIVDQPATADYRIRSLYWKAQCAKARDDKSDFKKVRATLFKEAPLSLHAMLSEPLARDMSRDPASNDPWVTYRSLLKPELNDTVRAVEAVQGMGRQDLSDELLATLGVDRMAESEPSFQLYYAVLYKRSGEVIRKFQLLSNLMKTSPEIISRPALEMFYPLRSFELVKAHEELADPYLVVALIRQESAFNERARSHAGAMGLMQLMPATARRVGRVPKHRLYDPATNVKVGVRFFSMLLSRFDGDAELALAAYNAGPDRVDQWTRRYPVSNRLLFLDLIPFRETRDYVAAIARNYYWYSRLYDGEGRTIAGTPAHSAPNASEPPLPSPALRPKATMRVLSLLDS